VSETGFNKGFAPRVGFSYNWLGGGTTVLRGFGIYYSQITDNSEANCALTGPEGVFNHSASRAVPNSVYLYNSAVPK
jgi:hypothetical protein